MNRRTFLIRVGGVVVAVPAVLTLTACGDYGDDGGGGGADAAQQSSFSISSTGSGHIHQLILLCADLNADNSVNYTSTNTMSHTHDVVISAAEIADIAAGNVVTINTVDRHPHAWTISKPANACPS